MLTAKEARELYDLAGIEEFVENEISKLIEYSALNRKTGCRIVMEPDPGSDGKDPNEFQKQVMHYLTKLGYMVVYSQIRSSKKYGLTICW